MTKGPVSSILNDMPVRAEVLIRIAIGSLFGFAMSVAYLPRAVPTHLNQLIAIVTAVGIICVPTMVFTAGVATPLVLICAVMALVGMSIVLAAATIGDGAFVGIWAVYVLWMSGLKYGPNAKKTALMGSFGITIAGLLSLSYRPMIQNGITLSGGSLEELCSSLNEPATCLDSITTGADSVDVTVPGSGMFGGRSGTLSFDQQADQFTLHLQGGLWIVAGLWKWSGLTNPYATCRNFLIVMSWSMLVISTAAVLPPFRTARDLCSKAILPKAFKGIAALCKSPTDMDESVKQTKIIQPLVHVANLLDGGVLAGLTAFEPRLCKAPLECSWPILKQLNDAVVKEIFAAIAVDALHVKEHTKSIANFGETLEACSVALATTQDPSQVLEKAERGLDTQGFDSADRFMARSSQVLDGTMAWLNAIIHPDSPSPCSKEAWKNIRGTYKPWLGSSIALCKGLLNTLLLPFRPKLWNLRGFHSAINWTGGFVVLVCLTVFWDGYANFGVDADDFGVTGLFHGWHLVSYGFIWKPTFEGTVKMAIQRGFGTCMGGFLAWLGLIICAGSYAEDAPVNPYGLIAWLTFTTTILGFVSIDAGPTARLGMNKDHGKWGAWAAMTQAIIATGTQNGKGTRNDLVVNRIIANLTGCVAAFIIGFLPPRLKGNDPNLVRDLLVDMKASLRQCLNLLVSGNGSEEIDAERTAFTTRHMEQHKLAVFYIKDATVLQRLPFLKIDPRLMAELEGFSAVTGTSVGYIFSFASYIAGKKELAAEFESGTKNHDDIVKIIEKLGEDDGYSVPTKEAPTEAPPATDEDDDDDEIELSDSQVDAAESGKATNVPLSPTASIDQDEVATFMDLVNETVRRMEIREQHVDAIVKDHEAWREKNWFHRFLHQTGGEGVY